MGEAQEVVKGRASHAGVDFEAGASVAGQKFYFLKNEAVLLELALIQYAMTTLIHEGLDEPPYLINMVLNVHRNFQGAMPYTPRVLQMMVDLLPQDSVFCVSGIGPSQLPAAMNSLLLGGDVRVGLEDNIYYAQGDLATNVRLMERLVRQVRDMGYEPATPAEARQLLGLTGKAGPIPEFAIR